MLTISTHYKKIITVLSVLWVVCPKFLFGQIEQSNVSINDYRIVIEQEALYLVADGINTSTVFMVNRENRIFHFINGKASFTINTDFTGKLVLLKSEKTAYQLYHIAKLDKGGYLIRNIPLWLSLIPPFLAILLALLTKEVIISLFLGIFSGSFIAGGLRIDSIYYSFQSLLRIIDHYFINALSNTGNISVLVSLLIGGMVAVIARNGGIGGIVNRLSKYARSARNAQLTTWLLGMVIFFDGYANIFIIGNTMQAITDKFKVSREKLAYIVDSTTAPVSSVAFIVW